MIRLLGFGITYLWIHGMARRCVYIAFNQELRITYSLRGKEWSFGHLLRQAALFACPLGVCKVML
jgi:hypothetical protein